MSLPPIRARLLGSVDLRLGGAPIAWPRRDARALFLFLLVTPGHRRSRDEVLDALWPGIPLETARNSLYKSLHALRRALEPGLRDGRRSAVIVGRHDTIEISPAANVWVDIDHFEALLREADEHSEPRTALSAALDLYRGPLLANEPRLEWAGARRAALASAYERATLLLARLDLEQGLGSASIGRLQALLQEDPFAEDAHRALIHGLVQSGQLAAAREHLAWANAMFEEELGVPFEIDGAELTLVQRPAVVPAGVTPIFGLPGVPAETLGREDEIAAISARLTGPASRAICITGPGGAGKTRVAIEVARRSKQAFPGGIVFVDLTAIDDRALLIAAIGRAMGSASRPHGLERETVLALVRRMGHCLLVLDNLEHIPGVAREVASLLEAAPEVRVLATSRTPLRIRAEIQMTIEPFVIPSDDDPEELERNPAVQLYLQRSADWHGSGAVHDPIEIAQIARLCRYLDGLPLAIELAASHSHDLTIDQLLDEASSRFDRLTDGPLDLPDRQRTLEATLDWSCRLLTRDQLELFAFLGVFMGGASPEALVAIAGEAPAASADDLVEQHMARWSGANGRRRLTQLETMRSYSRFLLERHDRWSELRLRHARYFADQLSAGRGRSLTGLEQIEHAAFVERESANVHRAVESALELGEGVLAARICAAMGLHWFTFGPSEAALPWIEKTLESAYDTISDEVAWTALWGAAIAWQRGDIPRFERFEAEARRGWGLLDSKVGLARVDHAVAQRLAMAGNHAEALQRHRANLAVFEATGEIEGIVFSRAGAADALVLLGRYDEILAELEAALDVARASGDFYLQSHVLMRLPGALLDQSDLDRSEQLSLEAERVALLVRDRLALPWAAVMRAWIAWERGDDQLAIDLGQLAVERYRDAGDEQNEVHGLVPIVAAMNRAGEPDALAVAQEVISNLIEMPSDLSLALGLPPIAETLYRYGAIDEARIVLAGGERAAVIAAVPRHGISTRYRTLVRGKITESDAHPFREERVDPQYALDVARTALERLT